jgi:hypothetical protein
LIVPDKHMLRIYSKKALESETPAGSVVKIEIPSLSTNSETQKLFIQIPKLRGRLFFFDEANVSWCPQTGRIYRVKGEDYKVNTPQAKTRPSIYWVHWSIQVAVVYMRYMPVIDIRSSRHIWSICWMSTQMTSCLWFATAHHNILQKTWMIFYCQRATGYV